MIKVRMRKQDYINMRQVVKLQRGCGQTFRTYGDPWQTDSYTRKKNGVAENCDTEKIDEHCGVA
jgi:hypothetical protein